MVRILQVLAFHYQIFFINKDSVFSQKYYTFPPQNCDFALNNVNVFGD